MDDDYTDEEREYNFLTVVSAVDFIRNKKRVTEDWLEEQKKHVMRLRNAFPYIHALHMEIQDSEFRKFAYQSEMLLQDLVVSIRFKYDFDLSKYLKLCENLLGMIKFIYEEKELEDAMKKMELK